MSRQIADPDAVPVDRRRGRDQRPPPAEPGTTTHDLARPTQPQRPDGEHRRLLDVMGDDRDNVSWRRWGPYVSERSWATVREDYSGDGDAWAFLPHDLARSKAYRWGEDGIAGICDRYQILVFAPAFWNGRDPILKERLFGLTPHEGNHGEDVKEYYFHVDNTPTHSYMRYSTSTRRPSSPTTSWSGRTGPARARGPSTS